jgi:hypothetical protein
MTGKGRKGSQQHFGIVLRVDGMMDQGKALGKRVQMYSIHWQFAERNKGIKAHLDYSHPW